MIQKSREYQHLLKYVIVGDSSVGKSCLLIRFSDDQFSENYTMTIGVDFRFKTVSTSNNKKVKLQIWDTAGQQRFRTITNTYYKNAQAVLFVYDITCQASFDSISNYWLNEVESYAESDVKLILIGNKSDLNSKRQVSTEVAQNLANDKKMIFWQTSAKTADHVNECFMNLTEAIIKQIEKNHPKRKFQISQPKIDLNKQGTTQNQTANGACC